MKAYYPLMIDLSKKKCIVIGGGQIAQRKVWSLLRAKASITVISPNLTEHLEKLVIENQIDWVNRAYHKGDLLGYFIVVIATDNKKVNMEIYQHVNEDNQFVNIVDNPALCTFIVPSTITRGKLQIAISTNGASPGLAKKIRMELEQQYGEHYTRYTDFLANMRQWILQQNLDQEQRKKLFSMLLDDVYLERVANGEKEEIEMELKGFIALKFLNEEK